MGLIGRNQKVHHLFFVDNSVYITLPIVIETMIYLYQITHYFVTELDVRTEYVQSIVQYNIVY